MKKLLHSIAVPLFFLFVGGSLLPSAKAFDEAKTAKLQESSVRILTITADDGKSISYGTGTGFIINETGNIVTNQHVVDGAMQFNGSTQIFAIRRVGAVDRLYKCKCEPSQQSKEVDLAVLSSSIRATPLNLNTMEPKDLADVFTVGFPGIADDTSQEIKHAFLMAVLKRRDDPALEGDGADISREMSENKRLEDMTTPSFTSGKVRRIGNQILEEGGGPVRVIDCDLNSGHGNSGGPLLDLGGYVVGVVGRGATKPQIEQNVTVGIDKVNWVIAESELERFLKDRNIAFHHVNVDVAKIGQLTLKQKIFIALACVSAMIAAGLAFFLFPRRQPAPIPTPTSVIDEKIQRILAARGGPAQPNPKSTIGSVWDFEIQGPGGFRQNVRLTDADFKRGRGRVVLGRNSDFSDVLVKHDSVSRQHLHFELRDNGLAVADRHSSNGTKINGKSLSAPFRNQPVREGDRIQFGELTASVRRGF